MKVKHNRRQYKLTYKKNKQYRSKPKKQKTKRLNQKPNAKSSYRRFKKSIKHIQRGGVPVFLHPGSEPGLPAGWVRVLSDGKPYYYNSMVPNSSTWDRPKHDQWFYGNVSFPPIPDQTIGTQFQLQANTVFDNNGTPTYTGLPVVFVSSDPSVASIQGTTLLINAAGIATIWAYQPGTDIFKPTNEWQTENSTRTVTVYPPPPAHTYPYHAPPLAHAQTYHAPTPTHAHTPAQQSMSPLHNIVFNFNGQCDPTLPLDRQSEDLKKLISSIQTNPNAYNPDRGHTFLYSAFRGTGNTCLIAFMLNPLYNKYPPTGSNIVKCDIMQPNKPMPTWVWQSDDGTRYSHCDPITQDLLEYTLVNRFVTDIPTTHVVVQGTSDVTSNCTFNFDPINITTSGTQVVVVEGVGTKTDIVVSRDITTGTWIWFMNDEQFNYPSNVSHVLETEFKTNNGNGFCKFTSPGLIISEAGQPTVNLKQVKFTTNAVLRQTNVITASARSVIRVCDTSYPFHGAIERLRTARTLDEALRHGNNINKLAGMVHDMHIIKTLRNDIFYSDGTKHAFMAIDELLVAKTQLLRSFNNNPRLCTILDSLVTIFSIPSKDEGEADGKPLTPCTNVRVITDDKIEITINSRSVNISIGSFITFDRWVMNYNPTLTISIAKTKAIVTHFGGSFNSADHTKSNVNRIFYLPWREDERRWTTSSYPRAIGLTSGYLNEYWDTIQVIECPSPTLCTIAAINKWQNEYITSASKPKK